MSTTLHFNNNEAIEYYSDRADIKPTTEIIEKQSNVIDNKKKGKIYRHNFSSDFMEKLYVFAKFHQFDDRANYKEAWKEWVEENDDIINIEIKQLTENNFQGDILDKMYKSGRYYFRKKHGEKQIPKKRRNYISVTGDLITIMDDFIKKDENKDKKPHDGFLEFCQLNIDYIKTEIIELQSQGLITKEDINNKLKKTFKNRYFLLNH